MKLRFWRRSPKRKYDLRVTRLVNVLGIATTIPYQVEFDYWGYLDRRWEHPDPLLPLGTQNSLCYLS